MIIQVRFPSKLPLAAADQTGQDAPPGNLLLLIVHLEVVFVVETGSAVLAPLEKLAMEGELVRRQQSEAIESFLAHRAEPAEFFGRGMHRDWNLSTFFGVSEFSDDHGGLFLLIPVPIALTLLLKLQNFFQ